MEAGGTAELARHVLERAQRRAAGALPGGAGRALAETETQADGDPETHRDAPRSIAARAAPGPPPRQVPPGLPAPPASGPEPRAARPVTGNVSPCRTKTGNASVQPSLRLRG